MAWCSTNHRNNKSMWCFCFERFCFHKFSWKLLTFNQREQSQFQLEMNVYCISWLRQISEFDCCSCPSNISFKFINCCSPLVWTFLHKILQNPRRLSGIFHFHKIESFGWYPFPWFYWINNWPNIFGFWFDKTQLLSWGTTGLQYGNCYGGPW